LDALNLHDKDLTIRRLMREMCAAQGDHPCILFGDDMYSYSDVDRLSDLLSSNLISQGVVPGTKVAVIMGNRPEFILLYLALAKSRAVAVPINVAAKGEMLRYFLVHGDVEHAIVEGPHFEAVAAVAGETVLKRIYLLGDSEAPAPPDTLGGIAVRAFEDLSGAPAAPAPSVEPLHTDPYILLYTSGTTGRSKASVGTHHSSLSVGLVMRDAYDYSPADILYVCLPLFHGNAWQCSCLPALVSGATIALSQRFSVSSFWDEVRACKATQFNLLASMTNWIWSQQPDPDDSRNAVRQCMIVPTPAAFYDEFRARFGIDKIQSVYAMTDLGVVAITRMDDPPDKKLSAGRACDIFDVRIFDDEDNELPAGSVGEIVVRNKTPWVMPLGYYNDSERTLQAWRNLWFHTGDRGCFDADGFLYFVDRKSDSIRRVGENISSYEVEQIVLAIPGVRDVAAFAVPSDESEDEVMISVVREAGWSFDEAELFERCVEKMPRYMLPRYIQFVHALPMTMTEKPEKHRLKEQAIREIASLWDGKGLADGRRAKGRA
jgi:crotonobetaine/carnitine-CoA ligase